MNLCATLTFLNMLLLGIVSVTNMKTIMVSAQIKKSHRLIVLQKPQLFYLYK